jgi:hypothetical protein
MPRSVLYKSMSLDGVITGPDDDAVEHAGVQARLGRAREHVAVARRRVGPGHRVLDPVGVARGGRPASPARSSPDDPTSTARRSIPSPSAKAYR